MSNKPELIEKTENYQIEVYFDDSDPKDLIDQTIFDNEEQFKEYLAQFENGLTAFYGVVIKKICKSCGQPEETTDSIWGIEAESATSALDDYMISHALPELQDEYAKI